MSREKIRQDIMAAVNLVLADYAIDNPGENLILETDNRILVDTKTQQKPFAVVRIKYLDAYQRDLGNNPAQRVTGQIEFCAAAKDNTGTAEANRILDYFVPKLHKRTLGSVRTYMSDMGHDTPHLGWTYYTMLVPFWSDQES